MAYGLEIVGGSGGSVFSDADIVGRGYVGGPAPAAVAVGVPMGAPMVGPAAFVPWQGPAPQGVQQGYPVLPQTTQARPAASHGVLRKQILPLGSGSLAPGASITLNQLPQRPTRIDRLVITQYAAGVPVTGIVVGQILVGTDPQFNAAGPVDAAIFAPGAFGTELRGSTANPGISVAVTLTNPTAAAIDFLVSAIGESVDG